VTGEDDFAWMRYGRCCDVCVAMAVALVEVVPRRGGWGLRAYCWRCLQDSRQAWSGRARVSVERWLTTVVAR